MSCTSRSQVPESQKMRSDKNDPTPFDPYREWLGITSLARPPGHYDMLGVPRFTDDRQAILQQYRARMRLVKRYAIGQHAQQSQDVLDQLARAMLCLVDSERKADYDRSLGCPQPEMALTERRGIEQVLLQWELITPEGVSQARALAEESGISLREAICRGGLVSPEVATQALAEAVGVPYVDLARHRVARSLIAQVPRDLVRRHKIFPVAVDKGQLIVACADPANLEFEQPLRFVVGLPIRVVLASPDSLRKAIARGYGSRGKPSGRMDRAARPTTSTAPQTGVARATGDPTVARRFQFLFWTTVEFILARPWIWITLILILAAALAVAARWVIASSPVFNAGSSGALDSQI